MVLSNFLSLSLELPSSSFKSQTAASNFVLIYWGLNSMTIKNLYLLLLIDKSLDCLGQAKYFTELDLTSAYHQIRIHESDKWKTTFQTQYNYFEYQIMSFGLFNTSASFQDYVNKIFAKKLDVFVIIFLDNILFYIEDLSQLYVKTIYWVLKKLWKHRLFTNLKKCYFHQDKVQFLGYMIFVQDIWIENNRIEVFKTWPEPQLV